MHRAVRFHPCAYADASPGVGSLVGREFAQSLGARLLVSVFARDGSHSYFRLHFVLRISHTVLFSNVIAVGRFVSGAVLVGRRSNQTAS